jgi:hypothetical protein
LRTAPPIGCREVAAAAPPPRTCERAHQQQRETRAQAGHSEDDRYFDPAIIGSTALPYLEVGAKSGLVAWTPHASYVSNNGWMARKSRPMGRLTGRATRQRGLRAIGGVTAQCGETACADAAPVEGHNQVPPAWFNQVQGWI